MSFVSSEASRTLDCHITPPWLSRPYGLADVQCMWMPSNCSKAENSPAWEVDLGLELTVLRVKLKALGQCWTLLF